MSMNRELAAKVAAAAEVHLGTVSDAAASETLDRIRYQKGMLDGLLLAVDIILKAKVEDG